MKRMREIKTLLLCKVKPTVEKNSDGEIIKYKDSTGKSQVQFKGFCESYKNIYDPQKENAKETTKGKEQQTANAQNKDCERSDGYKRYMTLGGFDALAVYSPEKKSDEKWLEAAWRDKTQVIKNINEELSYHPIHLVRSTNQAMKKKKPPVMLLTFVYGIDKNKGLFSKEDKGNLLIIGADGRFCQESEKNGKNNKSGNEETGKTCDGDITVAEVYRCINISDRVLLTYTDHIAKALKAIYYLEEDGYARRTYTTVNFPLNENGEIPEDCFDRIMGKKPEVEQEAEPGAEQNAESEPRWSLRVMIQGTIRNTSVWECRKAELRKILKKGLQYEGINFGEADFAIAAEVDGTSFVRLLKEFLSNSKLYASGCWDIHTEIQLSKPETEGVNQTNGDPEEDILSLQEDILSLQEERFNKLFDGLDPEWDWKYVLKEVLSAQASIDRHPMFRGPAYLLWHCFDIINDYLTQYTKTDQQPNTIPDIIPDKIYDLLSQSGERIESFSHCTSQLTDQLTRNDDIIFRGLGRVPAITSTLPENLLEIYHAFLRKLADELIKTDKEAFETTNNKWEDPGYKYSFLIAPEMYQRPLIFQLFHTDVSFHKDNKIFYSWPTKQCHVIQLPLGDVYNPMQCLIPLVHECFHFFGDHYRSRGERADRVMRFLSVVYVDCVLYAEVPNCNINKYERNALITAVRNYLGDASIKGKNITIDKAILKVNEKETSSAQYELFLEKLISQLRERFYELLSEKGTREIYHTAKEKNSTDSNSYGFVYYRDSVEKRQDNKRKFFWASEPIKDQERGGTNYQMFQDVQWLFKECYADFMTVMILDLRPSEYLGAFNNDLGKFFRTNGKRSFCELNPQEQGQMIIHCQRIAIVLAAYYRCTMKEAVDEEVMNKITSAIKTDFLSRSSDGENSSTNKESDGEDVQDVLRQCFQSLILIDDKGSGEQLNTEYESVFPPSALREVVWYLKSVYQEKVLSSKEGTQEKQLPNKIKDIQKNFTNVFRKEDLFGTEADEIINEHRKNVDEEIKKQKITVNK